jgi:hypothetical protein
LVSVLRVDVPELRPRRQRAKVEHDPDRDRAGVTDPVPRAWRDEQRGARGQFPRLAVKIRRRVPFDDEKELLGIRVVVLGNPFSWLQ